MFLNDENGFKGLSRWDFEEQRSYSEKFILEKFIDILGQGIYSLGDVCTEEKTRIF